MNDVLLLAVLQSLDAGDVDTARGLADLAGDDAAIETLLADDVAESVQGPKGPPPFEGAVFDTGRHRWVKPVENGAHARDETEKEEPEHEITKHMHPSEITPLHHVKRAKKFEDLVADMKENGWQGRPILVVDDGKNQAWTGSHRLAAAKAAGLDSVPTQVISWDDYQTALEKNGMTSDEAESNLGDDDDRMRFLKVGGLSDALKLMHDEI